MENLKLEIKPEVAAELLKAIAMRIEYAKHSLVESHLLEVAAQIEKYAKEKCGYDISLERMRYPIKRVTITFYEENPKRRP